MQVRRTHIMTRRLPLQLPRLIRVVRNIQIKAIPTFLEIYRSTLNYDLPRNIQIKAIPTFLEINRSKLNYDIPINIQIKAIPTFLEIYRSKLSPQS